MGLRELISVRAGPMQVQLDEVGVSKVHDRVSPQVKLVTPHGPTMSASVDGVNCPASHQGADKHG